MTPPTPPPPPPTEQRKTKRRVYNNNNWIYIVVLLLGCLLGGGAVAAALILTRGSSSGVPSVDQASTSADILGKGNPVDPSGLIPTFTFEERKTVDDYKCGISFLEYEGDETEGYDEDPMNIFSPNFEDSMSESNGDGFNRPLRCNNDMMRSLKNNTSCCDTTLSSLLEIPQSERETELVIPCGKCVIVDFDDVAELELPGGLRIEGILYFPPTSSITIRTTHVWVVGTLKIDVLDPGNQVKFHLYGDDEVEFLNTGGHSELEYCSSKCSLGTKPIAVIGGRLEIQAYDPSCVAWEKLQAVLPPLLNPSCGYQSLLENGDMEENKLWTWAGYGNERAFSSPGYGGSGHSIVATGGVNWSRGVHQALEPDCLEMGQEFTVRAKVKLYDTLTNQPISCDRDKQESDRNCPMVRLYFLLGEENHQFFQYYDDEIVWTDGEWNDLEITFPIEVEPAEVQRGNIILCGGPVDSTLEIDNVVMIPKAEPINQIVVSPEAAKCWQPGVELLLTSHTKDYNDRQVVTIESVDVDMGVVVLNQTIAKPVTLEDHEIFAVEVASLTRPVVFEAESNSDDELIGGHLIVFGTPTPQHLEGVEIRNFGQQGRLGRYPTHFHFCGDSYGSVMRRNVVRDSNQRCYVVHQTNGVLLEENIAFNAFGHCYFLEDGVEVDNIFRDNLGADIKTSTRLLSIQSGRTETDNKPSMFWISNPSNYFYGNVAAGGNRTGYWFETPGARAYLNLGAFDDNEGHSMLVAAFTSYPPGWQPRSVATINNIKAYRNPRTGLFLHVTRNLMFIGGVVADSVFGAYVLQGDNVTFVGTRFMGDSTKPEVPSVCHPGEVGLMLHATKLAESDLSGTVTGTTLIDVEFTNFSSETTGCTGGITPLQFSSSHISTPTFDAPHTFLNVTLEAGSEPLNACPPLDSVDLDDIIIEVAEDPAGTFSTSSQPGFLVSPKLTSLVGGTCTPYSDCFEFCENTCLRTVRFLTSSGAGNYKMVASDGSNSLAVTRSLRSPNFNGRNFNAVYNVALPLGNFQIHFEDENGLVVYPDYVIPILEAEPLCMNHIQYDDITVVRPQPDPTTCSNLVKNGDFDSDIVGWQDTFAGITWDATAGVSDSGALTTTTRLNSGQTMSQWFNVNCIAGGQIYDFSLSFKLVGAAGQDYPIDCSTETCPDIMLWTHTFQPETGEFDVSDPITVATTILTGADADGFRKVSGRWQVTAEQAEADKLLMVFNVYQPSVQYVVDAVLAVPTN